MDVEESYLMPGLVGVYRLQVYVPWYRRCETDLLIIVRAGKVTAHPRERLCPILLLSKAAGYPFVPEVWCQWQ